MFNQLTCVKFNTLQCGFLSNTNTPVLAPHASGSSEGFEVEKCKASKWTVGDVSALKACKQTTDSTSKTTNWASYQPCDYPKRASAWENLAIDSKSSWQRSWSFSLSFQTTSYLQPRLTANLGRILDILVYNILVCVKSPLPYSEPSPQKRISQRPPKNKTWQNPRVTRVANHHHPILSASRRRLGSNSPASTKRRTSADCSSEKGSGRKPMVALGTGHPGVYASYVKCFGRGIHFEAAIVTLTFSIFQESLSLMTNDSLFHKSFVQAQ